MFLNQLEETNKENFLKICVHAALANGVFAKEEKETLFAYCREMNIKEHVPEIPEAFEELVKVIDKNMDEKEKKICILETLALVKCDGFYDDEEQTFIRKLSGGLGLSDDVLRKFNELLDKYLKVGKEIFTAITE